MSYTLKIPLFVRKTLAFLLTFWIILLSFSPFVFAMMEEEYQEGLPGLGRPSPLREVEEKLKAFESHVLDIVGAQDHIVEKERLFLEKALSGQKEGPLKEALTSLLERSEQDARQLKWIKAPEYLIRDDQREDLETTSDLTVEHRGFSSLRAVIQQLRTARCLIEDVSSPLFRCLLNLEQQYSDFIENIIAIMPYERLRVLRKKPVRMRSRLSLSHEIEGAMALRMCGKYSATSDSEHGTHEVRRIRDLYFKKTHPICPVNPGIERALYGLYHFMFGENNALAPASLLSLEDVLVKKAVRERDQKRIEQAIEIENLLEKPNIEFLQGIIRCLLSREGDQSALEIIKEILGEGVLQRLLLGNNINRTTEEKQDVYMEAFRSFLNNSQNRSKIEFILGAIGRERLSSVEADPDIQYKMVQESDLVQVNKAIEGPLLEKNTEQDLDPKTFTIHVLGSLIAHGADYKGDNFIVTPEGCVVGIDNDVVFQPTFKRETESSHLLQLKNILYFMKGMEGEVDSDIKARFLERSPETIMLQWLLFMKQQNTEYSKIKPFINPTLLGDASGEAGSLMNLPVHLSRDLIKEVYHGLQRLRAILKAPQTLTLQRVFEKLECPAPL